MSLQMHCNCGWSGPVSEVYVGGQIACPDCGEQVEVSQPSTPYAYPPFPAWDSQRRKTVKLPPAPQAPVCGGRNYTCTYQRSSSCEAWNALGLSIAGLVLAFGDFSWVASIVLSVCAILIAIRARRTAASEHRPKPFKSVMAISTSIVALMFASSGFLGGKGCDRFQHVREEIRGSAGQCEQDVTTKMRLPAHHYSFPQSDERCRKTFQTTGYTDECETKCSPECAPATASATNEAEHAQAAATD
jgi:hypothetical protein